MSAKENAQSAGNLGQKPGEPKEDKKAVKVYKPKEQAPVEAKPEPTIAEAVEEKKQARKEKPRKERKPAEAQPVQTPQAPPSQDAVKLQEQLNDERMRTRD
jgi:hypothetical protein